MSEQQTVSDFLVRRLTDWGVRRLYGYAGDGINGILGAIRRAGNRPEFLPVAHEELAALMACADAKFGRGVGVCLATQGPGAIHLLNGLYDAVLDHQPVVAIVGQQSRMSMGAHYQQEVDLPTLFKDVAGAFVQTANDASQVRHLVDRAFRVALDRRTVTCIIVPHDVQSEPAVEEPPQQHGTLHSGVGWSAPRVVPEEADLRRAAEVLERRPSGGDVGRGGRTRARAMRSSRLPRCWAPAWPRRCWARRRYRTISRSSPARSAGSVRERATRC